MNTRAKGRKFEKREEAVWKECGWETELVRPEARFIGPGKFVTAYRDFFKRYDLIVTSPRAGVTLMIQISTEPPSSHKDPGPMGFPIPFRFGSLESPSVEEIMENPTSAGTFEVFVQYKRQGRGYEATRTWWWKRA